MKRFLVLALGAAAGFLAGSKVGHGPYHRIRDAMRRTASRAGLPEPGQPVAYAADSAASAASSFADRVRSGEHDSEDVIADVRDRASDPWAPSGPPAPVAGTMQHGGAIRPGL